MSEKEQAVAKSMGILQAEALLEQERMLYAKHQKGLLKVAQHLQNVGDVVRLHLGCGSKLKSGWTNIDLMSRNADLQLDLREPWPFTSRSVEHIYSEHVFEHLEHPTETQHFLAEAMRVLRSDGIFDVGVPDTEWPLRAYSAPFSDYWVLAKATFHPTYCHTRLEHINYHFRQEGRHKYAWDQETLATTLRGAGFKRIQAREWSELLDSADRRHGTIYFRAFL